MWYIYPQIILALAIGLYLCCCFRHQPAKNWTTLGLATGFFSFALAGIFHFLVISNLDLCNNNILCFLRYLFLVSALIYILWAVIRLITESVIFRYVLPVFIYIVGILLTYWGVYLSDNTPLVTFVISYIFFIPLDLTLGIFFLLLYSRLSFMKDGFQNNLGPFFLSLGWLIHAINMSRLYFVLDKSELDIFLLLISIPYVFWLIGFILLEKETEKAFETKLQIHGLKRSSERESEKSSERGNERKKDS